MTDTTKTWLRIALATTLALLLTFFAALQYGLRSIKEQIEIALGPHGAVETIRIGPTGVEIGGIRIRAAEKGKTLGAWPTEDELRAERIVVTPSITDLFSARIVIKSIRIDHGYISMLRASDGRMMVLPSLLQRSSAKANGKTTPDLPRIDIARVELSHGTLEFFDATLRKIPVKQHIEEIEARIDNLQLPDLAGESSLEMKGVLKGPRKDGQLTIGGKIELASKESDLTTQLRGVDLVSLQPYLIKAAETGVRKGTLDLDLRSRVHNAQLKAPGTLTLSNLELASASRTATIMGIPQTAAIGLMKDGNGKISVKFVLEGNINDPHFSLNESLTTRLASSLASSLGVSLEGLARGVQSVGSGTTKGIADSLGKLFGK